MDDPQLCPFPYFRKYWMAETAHMFARRAGNGEGNYNTRKKDFSITLCTEMPSCIKGCLYSISMVM